MSNIYKYYLIIILTALSTAWYSNVQAKPTLTIIGQVESKNAPLSGCKISITSNDSVFSIIKVKSDGFFEFKLATSGIYYLSLYKDGYATKRFIINTNIPEGFTVDSNYIFEIFTDLLPIVKTIDYSVFDQPVLIVRYNTKSEYFSFDWEYALAIDEKIYAIETQIYDLEMAQKKYDKLIVKADHFYKEKNYPKAYNKYLKSASVKSHEAKPHLRMFQIYQLSATVPRYYYATSNILEYK